MSMEIENIRYCYGGDAVLKGISFTAERGEVLFILGQNGAGKSTLLKCMLGLYKGYTGKILIDGMNLKRLQPKQIARKAAYIPQSHQPTFDYPVIEAVLMGAVSTLHFFSAPGQELRKKAMRLLDELHILHLAQKGYSHISGGERQLVLIARALMQDAPMLFMDEPTSSLDFGNQQQVLATAKILSRRGYGIVLTSHHPEQAFMYADRVLVIMEGRVAKIGPSEVVLTEALLEKVYHIPIRLANHLMGQKTMTLCIPACETGDRS